MAFYSKVLKFLDSGLISGSGDPLRTALGSFYSVDSKSRYVFNEYSTDITPEDVVGGSATIVDLIAGRKKINDYIDYATMFTKDMSNLLGSAYNEGIELGSRTPIPIMKYPIRLYGDNDTVYSDLHWKNYFIGGTYGEQEYPGIYSTQEFSDHIFAYNFPYLPKVVKESNPNQIDSYKLINITYDYNYYYKNYEKSNSEKNDVLEIPNGYMLQSFSAADQLRSIISPSAATPIQKFANSLYGLSNVNFVTREGKFDYNLYRNFFVNSQDREDAAAQGEDLQWTTATPTTKKYFQYYYPLYSTSDITKEFVNNKLKNILFDHKVLSEEFRELYNNRNALPYYSRISLPAGEKGSIGVSLENSDTSGKFLQTLKEIFVNNSLDTKPSEATFNIQETNHLNPEIETNDIYQKSVKLLPMFDFLSEMRNNYINLSDDFYCVGNPYEPSRRALYDKAGNYRHLNTIGATNAMADLIDQVDEFSYLDSIRTPYGNSAAYSKYHETLAFRIEKIGGEPQGDSNTQEALQNFFIFNGTDLLDDFIDTQIKYGELYTYNIYAYVLVKGSRYQASDLRVTKLIADLTKDEDTGKVYCLEFYDPFTGERRDRLVEENTFVERNLENEFSTSAQVASANYKFLADFNVTVQPSVMLIEIPVATNIVRVMDHPVNKPQVTPFQISDNSQRVGFDIHYGTFEKFKYPPVLSSTEEILKNNYLDSNSLFEKEEILNESVSVARFIEVFRIDKKPTSYKDFENNKIYTADLRIKQVDPPVDEDGIPVPHDESWWSLKNDMSYTNHIFYDTINTNKEFYYAIRFLNERREPGHFTPVHVVNLINDGGYVYVKHDVIYEYELNPDKNINTTKHLKKMLNIVPNFQHMFFDDSEVDYTKSAFTQKENLKIGIATPTDSGVNTDSLWGKKFKFRLTSKKTGKKIDLNITYTLSRS